MFKTVIRRPTILRSLKPHQLRLNSTASEITSKLTQFEEPTLEALSHDQIGYLDSIGLAQGWVWPSQVLQHCSEYVHVYTGLPWWATIIVTTLGVRAAMFPLFVKASDNMARNQKAKPEMDKVIQLTREAKDMQQRQKAMLLRKQVLNKYGIKMRYLGAPILQLPIGFGFFFGIRDMALVPVQGFTEQGTLWFTNLAAADPYVGLQTLSALIFMANMKMGGETGMQTMSPALKKVLMYMPLLSIPVTMNLSSGVVLYFATTAVFSLIQGSALRSPGFRKFAKMTDLVVPVKDPKKENVGIFDALKNYVDDAKKNAESKAQQAAMVKEASDAQKKRQTNSDVIFRKRK